MCRLTTLLSLAAVLVPVTLCAGDPPYGDILSVRYAEKLWRALEERGLVGESGVMSKPYRGQHPHGAVLDTIEGLLTVGGHKDVVIIKRNYGGAGVSVSAVADNPKRWLLSVTVMFRRESGYDAENGDWFWAKYSSGGKVEQNDKGVRLAGRVAKGSKRGCIACHRSAPGSDLVFNNDRHR